MKFTNSQRLPHPRPRNNFCCTLKAKSNRIKLQPMWQCIFQHLTQITFGAILVEPVFFHHTSKHTDQTYIKWLQYVIFLVWQGKFWRKNCPKIIHNDYNLCVRYDFCCCFWFHICLVCALYKFKNSSNKLQNKPLKKKNEKFKQHLRDCIFRKTMLIQ